MNFENRVQKYKSCLTENDQKIINYLTENKTTILHESIVNLAEKANVSPATITRFCKKIGFNSFQEMKFSIGGEAPVVHDEGTFTTIYQYYQMIIKSTQQFISEEQTNKIVTLIKNAERVVFCGVGNSGLIAMEFNSRIERMGIQSWAVTDAHGMIMETSLLDENDMLICFSNSGETKSVIDSARLAQENKVFTVAVTNHENTFLTRFSNEVVLISSYKYIDDEKFINSQIPSLFLLDVLTYKLLNHQEHMVNYQTTLKAVRQYE